MCRLNGVKIAKSELEYFLCEYVSRLHFGFYTTENKEIGDNIMYSFF